MTLPVHSDAPWDPVEFERQLRAKGAGYHIHHPFNQRLNGGYCSPDEIRCWVANRFYYQVCIPRKDAAILANMPDRAHRRLWVDRILDHDGSGDYEGSQAGGIEAWTRLGEAVGLSRDELWSLERVVPGVRFACDAYVNFAARAPWQEAVCSSLTEMFAPQIHKDRLASWPGHYPWIEADGLQYFRSRIPLATRDVEHGLQVTLGHFTTRATQQRALEILQFKLDILWSMLDAIEKACRHD
ncbi:pyrroloquinoline-quinone synthase PqqC [Malikia spinosa]|jgi:pyrroloquinoline-quinone synthase|uniref:Pyrroloquinoline-quinone synthase n=1 Tax=Malikia spinosa TaxID=86180 RepID=A0A2S9KBY3_9BURK|nr:pyrroloquinoline-quinone synthase PqqC [Malikia spinosa]MYZ54035.1 pyrroloquinoline-quinone synthase PqqC [Malikia spinosa]PRD67961.1 pyrroloquinoline quinone biosynthesis protein C [Malikia spinosa]